MSSPNRISGVSKTESYLDLLKREIPIPKDVKDGVVLEHQSFVRYVARRIILKLPPHIDIDDLCSAGVIGLMEAIDRFDCKRNCDFRTFAEFRIIGAILDTLRDLDWVPRGVHKRKRLLDRVYHDTEQRLGRSASEDEIADALGISITKLYVWLNQIWVATLAHLEDLPNSQYAYLSAYWWEEVVENVNAENQFHELANAEVRHAVVCALLELPLRERLVIIMYYYEDLNQKEIGKILEITEQRVHQIRKKTGAKLQQKLYRFAHD